jgi:hypothetical protein
MNASLKHHLKHAPQQIALTEAPMPVLGERGMVRHLAIEPKPAEEMLSAYPRFRDDFRMSHFIVFKARKL